MPRASSIIGLEGKVVVITGAGQGVGRSAARTFAQEGARVVAVDVDGALVWLMDDMAIECGAHAPALADLEGDGDVEVAPPADTAQ